MAITGKPKNSIQEGDDNAHKKGDPIAMCLERWYEFVSSVARKHGLVPSATRSVPKCMDDAMCTINLEKKNLDRDTREDIDISLGRLGNSLLPHFDAMIAQRMAAKDSQTAARRHQDSRVVWQLIQECFIASRKFAGNKTLVRSLARALLESYWLLRRMMNQDRVALVASVIVLGTFLSNYLLCLKEAIHEQHASRVILETDSWTIACSKLQVEEVE